MTVPLDDDDDTTCTKCGATYGLDGEDGRRERHSHGMCWPCASEYALNLEGVLEMIANTSSKDIERIKRYAKRGIFVPPKQGARVMTREISMSQEQIVKIAEEHGLRSVKTIDVIEVRYRKGAGIEPSALREVVAYYHLDGRLIAVEDPCPVKGYKA